MEILHFKAENTAQRNALEGLAYWIADSNYIKERHGANNPELDRVDKTIQLIFSELDALGVPFWVQNSVIFFASDWRRYKSNYADQWLLKNRNIDLRTS